MESLDIVVSSVRRIGLCFASATWRKASWQCGVEPVDWLRRPNLTECVSPSVLRIENSLQTSRFTPGIMESLTDDVVAASDLGAVIYGGDLTHITGAMQQAVDQVELHVHELKPENRTRLLRTINDAVLRTSSNLLEDAHADSWRDLPQATQAETATRLIDSVESSAFQVARNIQRPTVVINVTINIVLEIRIVDVGETAEVSDASFYPKLDRRGWAGPGRGRVEEVWAQGEKVANDGRVEGEGEGEGWDLSNDAIWAECGDSITLTGNTIKQLGVDGLTRLVFATYENLDSWMQPQFDDDTHGIPELRVRHGQPVNHRDTEQYEQQSRGVGTVLPPQGGSEGVTKGGEEEGEKREWIVGTRIISASVNERSPMQPLPDPIVYTLEHRTKEEFYNPTCSFWEYSEKTMSGVWSTFGCQLLHTNQTHTSCACEHLTNFAVLMSVTRHKVSAVHEFVLSFITYLGCIMSIVCLLAAFLTFHCFKSLQCDRNTIHKNLVLCLCLAELVFLCGIMQHKYKILCSVIAGVLHYLFLAAFAWMSVEGVQLYVMLVEVFEAERSRVKWYYAAAYGLPVVIVVIAAVVYPAGYGTARHCWLAIDHGFIWAFVGPVCAIITVNLIMLSVAIFVMCRHSNNAANQWKVKQKGQLENIRSWIKGALVLVVLLGVTWIFGLFYINDTSLGLYMAYVFTGLNSLQGVFIFVFHCLMNDKVQKEYKKLVRRAMWLPENFRVSYGGAKASSSATPVNSTSSGGTNYLTRLLSNRRRKRSSTTSLPVSTSPLRAHGYDKMQQHQQQQQRDSGRDSALTDPRCGRRGSALTDSGIGCPSDSHIYSEPTEEPGAYLDPVRIKLDPEEEMYVGDMSVMEGSVADTDYMDDFTTRGGGKAGLAPGQRNLGLNPGLRGMGQGAGQKGAGHAPAKSINIDKYKIQAPGRASAASQRMAPMSESECSDSDVFNTSKGKFDTEPELLNSYSPTPSSNHSAFLSDDALMRQKLLSASSPNKMAAAAQQQGVRPATNDSSGPRPPPLPQRIIWNTRPDDTPPSDC